MFVTIIDLGRGREHPIIQVLHINTYYMYIFWVFMTIFLYVLIDWAKVDKRLKYIMSIFIAVIILINGLKLYDFNEKISSQQINDRKLIINHI